MVHGYTREEVLAAVERIARELAIDRLPHEVIFSTRVLKKQGTRVQGRPGD
jgi:hypothetical protein